jgi:hypothetical protein
VKALARLAHPNIVTAFDAEQAGDALFLVMEYVEGESVDRVLRRGGRLPVGLACDWIRQAAAGLQYAFEQGLMHRDLKPANLMLTPRGQVKILDFGLSRLLARDQPDSQTPEGVVVGTPDYLAPEQARDPASADVRADLYSLGCSWYEMLTGQPPFPGGSVLQKLLAHQDQAPRPVTAFRADVPPEMAAVLDRLLAKEPSRRFQTPWELLQSLEPWTAAAPAPRRGPRRRWSSPRGLAALAAVLLATLLGAGWWFGLGPGGRPTGEPERAGGGPEAALAKEGRPRAQNPQAAAAPRARAQAVAWVRAHNAFGPDHLIVEDTARQLDAKLHQGKAFLLRLNRQLVRSRRPMLLAGRRHDFFAFELPPGEPEILANSSSLTVTAIQSQEFDPRPPLTLSDLHLNQKLSVDGDQPLTGSMAYRAQARAAGKLAVRLTVHLGAITYTHYDLLELGQLEGQGRLAFRLKPLYLDANRATGLTVLFFDVCSFHDPSSRAEALVLSNTVADLVTVYDPKKRP